MYNKNVFISFTYPMSGDIAM